MDDGRRIKSASIRHSAWTVNIAKKFMNRKVLRKLVGVTVFAFGLRFATSALGQETIRYYGGPGLAVFYAGYLDLDLNWDGENDFGFGSDVVCTTGIPSICILTIITKPQAGTSVLSTNDYVAAIPAGALIGAGSTSGALWTTNSLIASVQTTGSLGGDSRMSPIQALGDGYCGFQLTEPDGVHFGWMRLRIANAWLLQPPFVGVGPILWDQSVVPTTSIVSFIGPNVTVTEWAYETRPNAPIEAGAIPGPSPLAAGLGSRPGNLRLAWQSEVGAAYCVQFKDSLQANSWEVVDMRVVATGASAAAEIPTPGITRFFRVVRAD
jgi:hypothetical protein